MDSIQAGNDLYSVLLTPGTMDDLVWPGKSENADFCFQNFKDCLKVFTLSEKTITSYFLFYIDQNTGLVEIMHWDLQTHRLIEYKSTVLRRARATMSRSN